MTATNSSQDRGAAPKQPDRRSEQHGPDASHASFRGRRPAVVGKIEPRGQAVDKGDEEPPRESTASRPRSVREKR